ncbi:MULTISPECIES: alpha/beta hydrolase [unclassified Pseudomonas]|jgi:predicted esterase|uniref:alpha/beta hydrolase n=1 Tax=unclassified Pseudomonas TaxID=196821 RepID=UPI00069EBCC7|nr:MULTISPECIES: dienelactone hydrolase family protein [unclassified Pseudomonas]WPN49678.1 dienelactone hydrolase family protein [Pseudomonas sp. P8_241]
MSANPHLQYPTLASGPAPEAQGGAAILIHGRTQSPADMLAITARINLPDIPYFAIQAAQHSWYPDKFMAPLENNQPALDFALARLEAAVVELENRGIARSRIVLIGFSQGACLACEYLYRHPHRWGGLIAFTGGLIAPPGTSWLTPDKLAGTPVFFGNSEADPWVPLARTEETAEVFRRMGAEVELQVYNGRGHEVGDEEIALGRDLLQRTLGL